MINTTRKADTMRFMVRFASSIVTFAAVAFLLSISAAAQNAAKGVDKPSSATEDECIAKLKSDAGWREKYEACTRLRQVGTAKSVPALAALLTDEKLSHMARYALEPMSNPESADALRKALGRTRGPQKTGVITSLGVKRDAKSVKAIAKALSDKDADVARAAAGALGRIGTVESAAVLTKFQKKGMPGALADAVAEGQLTAAERLVASGNAKLAVPVYTALLSDKREFVQLGAFRGLAGADPAGAPALVAKALSGNDPVLQGFAAQVISESQSTDLTKAYAALLPALPPAGQALLVRGLGDGKDAASRTTVVAALASNDKAVKAAAAKALGNVGTAEDVPALVALLGSGDPDLVSAARAALGNEKNKAFDDAIAVAAGGATGKTHADLVELLSDRMAPKAASIALAALSDGDAALRAAALRSLTKLGGPAEAPAVIELLKKTGDASERSEASKALNAIAAAQGDAVLPAVLDAMKGANPESRAALLRSLGAIGSAKALDPVVAALSDKNDAISNEAARVLGEWKSVDAAPHLLKLAGGKNAARKDAALRGYVRLAQAESNNDAKAKMLQAAMGVARKPEEKWLVLPAWGSLATKQSLDTLTKLLGDPSVKNEAAHALITAATAFAKADAANKPVATEAINAVLAKCDDANVKERAQKALDGLK